MLRELSCAIDRLRMTSTLHDTLSTHDSYPPPSIDHTSQLPCAIDGFITLWSTRWPTVSRGGGILWRPPSRTACLHCGFRSIRPISEATIFRIFINQVAADGLKQHQCASATMPPVSVSGSYSSTGAVDCPGQSEWLGCSTLSSSVCV